MSAFRQEVRLSSGQRAMVSGEDIVAWGGESIRKIVKSGAFADGATLSREQIAEANDIVNGKA